MKASNKPKMYLFHELASYLPLIEGEDFDNLVEDIRQFGQIEPAVLFDGKILDGRNRYRACKQLGIDIKVREWNPSEFTGITPLQFVISENIVRRHLNIAQRSEIGLLLLEEEEKLTKERVKEMRLEKVELMRLEKEAKERKDKTLEEDISRSKKKIEEMSKGETIKIVGEKVKVSGDSIKQAKKIKEVAKKDKEIAEEWEKAKKGDTGVSGVYKKVKEKEFVKSLETTEPEVKKAIDDKIITPKEAKEVMSLPKELKEAVIKTESRITLKDAKEATSLPEDVQKEVAKSKITIDQAKEISEFPKSEQRKAIVKQIDQTNKAEKKIIQQKKDIIKGKTPAPVKKIDMDVKFINAWKNTKIMDIPIKLKKQFLKSYSEETKQECIKIVKSVIHYLIKEFSEDVKLLE